MSIIPSQTRKSLTLAIQQHAQPPASTLVCSQFAPEAAAESFTVDPEYDEFQADTSAGSVTATMPAGAKCFPGKTFVFRKKHASNSFIVAFSGGELYEGASTITLTEDNAVAAIKWDPIAGEWVRAGAVGVGGAVPVGVVAKTDTQTFGPFKLSLVGADADNVRFQPGFAGTITGVLASQSAGTVATGAATATLTKGGAAPTSNTITHAIGNAAGEKKTMSPTGANCVFAATDEIRIAITGTNDGVGTEAYYTIQYTRS